MKLAMEVATWSKDPSTKVGAVIVDHSNRPVGLGFNGFPRGVHDTPERYADKPTKYKMIVHAEANAILNAVVPIQGFTLYATKFPCSECAKLIIQSGIARIVSPVPGTGEPWATDAQFSKTMFAEAVILQMEY
jgi:dCMP deaminase